MEVSGNILPPKEPQLPGYLCHRERCQLDQVEASDEDFLRSYAGKRVWQMWWSLSADEQRQYNEQAAAKAAANEVASDS